MKPDLRSTLELFGIFGVIASLIFVGIQLNQDRQIAIGESYQVRTQMRSELVLHEFDNNEHIADLARRWESGLTPSWWNDEVETYQQYLEGACPESYWRPYVLQARADL